MVALQTRLLAEAETRRRRLHAANLPSSWFWHRPVAAAIGFPVAVPVDVADRATVSAATDRVIEARDKLDVWVDAAVAMVFGPAGRAPPDGRRRAIETTYLGAVHGAPPAPRHLQAAGRGAAVQARSALACKPIPLQVSRRAKAAFRGHTDSLRCEPLHGRSGVRLNMGPLAFVNAPHFSWPRTRIDTAGSSCRS